MFIKNINLVSNLVALFFLGYFVPGSRNTMCSFAVAYPCHKSTIHAPNFRPLLCFIIQDTELVVHDTGRHEVNLANVIELRAR